MKILIAISVLIYLQGVLVSTGFIHVSSSGSSGEFERLLVQKLEFSDGTQLNGRLLPLPGSKSNPGTSCKELLNYVPQVDGIYWMKPFGKEEPFPVYCDMTTDGGGWTLLLKNCQNKPSTIYSDAEYALIGQRAQWIQGINTVAPLSTAQTAKPGKALLESVRWADFLLPGSSFQLRQTIMNTDKAAVMDQHFAVSDFSGVFLQDDAVGEDRAWKLYNRTVLTDTTGTPWSDPGTAQILFYPPFTVDVPFGAPLYTGCSAYKYTVDGCGHFKADGTVDMSYRRAGSAGIIFDDGDPTVIHEVASPWFPLFYADYDVLYIHLNVATFGGSGQNIVGMYWAR